MPDTETTTSVTPTLRAARILNRAVAQADSLTPTEAAHAAWYHGGPTVATIIAHITAQRTTPAA